MPLARFGLDSTATAAANSIRDVPGFYFIHISCRGHSQIGPSPGCSQDRHRLCTTVAPPLTAHHGPSRFCSDVSHHCSKFVPAPTIQHLGTTSHRSRPVLTAQSNNRGRPSKRKPRSSDKSTAPMHTPACGTLKNSRGGLELAKLLFWPLRIITVHHTACSCVVLGPCPAVSSNIMSHIVILVPCSVAHRAVQILAQISTSFVTAVTLLFCASAPLYISHPVTCDAKPMTPVTERQHTPRPA